MQKSKIEEKELVRNVLPHTLCNLYQNMREKQAASSLKY